MSKVLATMLKVRLWRSMPRICSTGGWRVSRVGGMSGEEGRDYSTTLRPEGANQREAEAVLDRPVVAQENRVHRLPPVLRGSRRLRHAPAIATFLRRQIRVTGIHGHPPPPI